MGRARGIDRSYSNEITPFINNEVIFTKKLMKEDYLPIPFDTNMRAIVVNIEPDYSYCSNIWFVTLDINGFEQENDEYAQANHPGNKFWKETKGYPKDGILEITVYGDDLPFKLARLYY